MPVTKPQADALASLAVAARPHGARQWDAQGVVAAIRKVSHLALADVAMATMRAAADRQLETPAPIGNPQAHCWRERIAEPTAPVREPYNPTGFCGICSHPEDRCRRLWADDHDFIPARVLKAETERPREAVHAAVEALREATGARRPDTFATETTRTKEETA